MRVPQGMSMSRLHARPGMKIAFAAFACLLFLVGMPLSATAGGGDGGVATDAGNTRASATELPSWGTYTGRVGAQDDDWYYVAETSPMPRCVEAVVTGENNMTATLSVEFGQQVRNFSIIVPPGATGRMALAVPSHMRSYLSLGPAPNDPKSGDPARPGNYTFTLSTSIAPPTLSGDASSGADAGAGPDGALPLQGSCTGGRMAPLSGIADVQDTYRFTMSAAGYVTYSLGASKDSLTLALTDGVNPLGAPVVSGQVATVYVPTPGTYYFSASRTDVSADEISYLIGSVVGPNPPANGCRPNC